jgi:hypothetical protein
MFISMFKFIFVLVSFDKLTQGTNLFKYLNTVSSTVTQAPQPIT